MKKKKGVFVIEKKFSLKIGVSVSFSVKLDEHGGDAL